MWGWVDSCFKGVHVNCKADIALNELPHVKHKYEVEQNIRYVHQLGANKKN